MTGLTSNFRTWHRYVDEALAVGTLTTIATGGALLGLVWRDGEVGRLFRLAGRGLLERLSIASGAAPLTSVAVGYLHHLVVATVWGVLLGLLVLPWRGAVRWLVVPCAAFGYFVLSLLWLPPIARIGYGVTGSTPFAVPVALALATALIGGLWFADEADD